MSPDCKVIILPKEEVDRANKDKKRYPPNFQVRPHPTPSRPHPSHRALSELSPIVGPIIFTQNHATPLTLVLLTHWMSQDHNNARATHAMPLHLLMPHILHPPHATPSPDSVSRYTWSCRRCPVRTFPTTATWRTATTVTRMRKISQTRTMRTSGTLLKQSNRWVGLGVQSGRGSGGVVGGIRVLTCCFLSFAAE